MAIKRFLGKGSPPPVRDKTLDQGGMFTVPWLQWWSRVPDTLESIPNIINTVSLTAQNASLSATDFSGIVLPEGLYRASYYARITTADGVSSSLTVVLAWTDGGVAMTLTGAAITGNTTASYQTSSIILHADADTDITYATTYASNTPGTMKYRLDLSLEKIKA